MQIKEAVVIRIDNLCKEKNIKYNALANLAGITPSSVYSLMDGSRNDAGIIILKKICDAFEITIGEFFSDEVFNNLEQEIK